MRSSITFFAMALILTLGMVLTACSSKSATQAPSNTAIVAPSNTATVAPATSGTVADGQTLLNERCTRCHNLTRVTTAKHTADQWTMIVSKMVMNGAKLSTDEQKVLVDYLAKNYGQ